MTQPERQMTGLWGWIKERSKPLLAILVIISLLLFIFITWQVYKSDNLGFDGKTLWDWIELLIIPVVLAIGVWRLNKSARENEREIAAKKREQDQSIADEGRNQATLEAYFDRMVELLVEYNLTGKEPEEKRNL